MGRANSNVRGMMLPVGREKPRVSAWLTALRSMARLAARRTLMLAQGDFGFHCSGMSSQKGASRRTGTRRRPAVRLSSSAVGPEKRYARSTSPFLRAASRVASSGMERMTRRLTCGVLRQ